MMKTFRDLYDFIQKAEKDEDGFVNINCHPRLTLDGLASRAGGVACILDGKFVVQIVFRITSPISAGIYRREDRVALNNYAAVLSGMASDNEGRWSKEFPLDSPLYRLCTPDHKSPELKELHDIIRSFEVADEDDDDYAHGENALIGSFSTEPDQLTAYVNVDDDYKQPHFHLKIEGQPFQTAIEYLRPIYIPHQGERRDRLTLEQVEWLIGFFQTEVDHPHFTGTVWNLACWDWERNNTGFGIPEGYEMPDYMELLREG
jgi:hypothetical protein